MQSPRTRFQLAKKDVEALSSIVNGLLFERAADAAMLQFQNNIPVDDINGFAKIQGARRFLETFVNLARVEEMPEISKKPELTFNT